MNDNIKRIAEQSWNKYPHALKFDTERFAESIIKECIDIVGDGGEFCSRPKLIEKIEQHFGIK